MIKTKECAECKHMLSCKGKPEHVKRCLNFEPYREEKKNG